MSNHHRDLLQSFLKIRDENRKKVTELYESRKQEFDALADKLGPADDTISDIKVGTAADLSGVAPENIINIKLDFSTDKLKDMLASGEVKKGVEWTDEDVEKYNPLCLCGCGRRSPLPSAGEWVPEGWRPGEEDRVYCCHDSVKAQGFLANRHEGHQIVTEKEECNLTVSDK